MTKFVINPNVKKSKIHKEIYGHFSEHLGRCIYEGMYVGEDSPIPNVNGMQKKTERRSSIPTGAVLQKTTALVPMSSLNCAVSWDARPM